MASEPGAGEAAAAGGAVADVCVGSFLLYVAASGRRLGWLRVDRVLGAAGIPKDSPAGREFERQMEERPPFRPVKSIAGAPRRAA